VLLARDRDGELLRSRPAQWEEGRLAVLARTSTFADVLSDLGGFLDPALVPAWAHWVTPEIEPRRYDTRFFVAWLPPGQATVSVGGEADEVFWTTPAAAVARFGQGSLDLLPPTHAVLASLAEYVTASDVLAASESRRIRPTLPRAVLAGAGVAWELVDARTGEAIGPGDGTPP